MAPNSVLQLILILQYDWWPLCAHMVALRGVDQFCQCCRKTHPRYSWHHGVASQWVWLSVTSGRDLGDPGDTGISVTSCVPINYPSLDSTQTINKKALVSKAEVNSNISPIEHSWDLLKGQLGPGANLSDLLQQLWANPSQERILCWCDCSAPKHHLYPQPRRHCSCVHTANSVFSLIWYLIK